MDQLYLTLMHGRTHPDACMNDWGFDGPAIGPLENVHFTYGLMRRMHYVESARKQFVAQQPHFKYVTDYDMSFEVKMFEGMVVFNEHYFGDWDFQLLNSAQAYSINLEYNVLCYKGVIEENRLWNHAAQQMVTTIL